jgi:hypothetical protein
LFTDILLPEGLKNRKGLRYSRKVEEQKEKRKVRNTSISGWEKQGHLVRSVFLSFF